MVTPLALKSPMRSIAVGTVSICASPLLRRKPSQLAKKNVEFLRIGPPREAPNSFWARCGMLLGSVNVRASKVLLRTNS